jgi:hypothetical protein
MSQKNPSFWCKLCCIAHKANTLELDINGIAQLAGDVLRQQDNSYFFQAWLVFGTRVW